MAFINDTISVRLVSDTRLCANKTVIFFLSNPSLTRQPNSKLKISVLQNFFPHSIDPYDRAILLGIFLKFYVKKRLVQLLMNFFSDFRPTVADCPLFLYIFQIPFTLLSKAKGRSQEKEGDQEPQKTPKKNCIINS